MSETMDIGSSEKLPTGDIMRLYLARHREVVGALGENSDEKAVEAIKRAETIFLNEDGNHPDVR